MTKKKKSDTELSTDITPKVAEAIVEVEVVLPVLILVGDMELSLDDAIDRLGQIQLEERVLKKEKEPMRDATQAILREYKVKSHTTPKGTSATLTSAVRCNVNKAYLESILDEDQMLLAFPPKIGKGIKITA